MHGGGGDHTGNILGDILGEKLSHVSEFMQKQTESDTCQACHSSHRLIAMP